MNNITDNTNLSWMAGFFDGEGTIGITRVKRHIRNVTYSYCLRTAIGNTEKNLLEPFVARFGGKLAIKKVNSINAAQCFSWSLHANKAIPFLLAILPYIKSDKKYWAIIYGIVFQTNRIAFGGKGRGSNVDVLNQNRNEHFYHIAKMLNLKGKNKKMCPFERTDIQKDFNFAKKMEYNRNRADHKLENRKKNGGKSI